MMDYENIEKWKAEGNPFLHLGVIIRNVLIMLLGLLIFLFKYLALTFPFNAVLEDSFRHYDLYNVSIESVWEKGDLSVIVISTDSSIMFDVYYNSTGVKDYDMDKLDFFTETPVAGMMYYDQLEEDGFQETSIFLYKTLGFIQFIGVVIFAIGALLFTYNPRKRYGHAQIMEAKVARVERVERYYGSGGADQN